MDLAAPAATRGHRSPETWARAQADYIAGMGAPEVCERYGLCLGTFRDRARKEGWRRIDLPDPEPPDEHDGPDLAGAGPRELADHAWNELGRAMQQGHTRAAQGWLKLHRDIATVAAERLEAEREAEREARRTLSARRIDAFADDIRTGLEAGRAARAASRRPDSSDSSDSVFAPDHAEPPANGAGPEPPLNRAARRRAEALSGGRR